MSARSHRRCRTWLLAMALVAGCGSGDPLQQARQLQSQQRFAASLELLRGLIEERSTDPEVHYRYGLALLTTGQPALALWPLRRAAESPEWESSAHLALSSAYLASGSHEKAIEMADRQVQRNPEDVAALVLRAEARVQSRRHYREALDDAERVLALDPDNQQVLATRVIALLALEREEEAAEALADLESLYRHETLGLHGSPGYCTARAKFEEEKGEVEAAAAGYEACLEQFPADGSLARQAMDFFERAGERERATRVLRNALLAQPDSQSVRLALATRLRDLGRRDEAEQVLREGTLREEPGVAAEAWAALARFLIDAERYDEAVDAFREARRLVGPDDVLLFATADALVMAQRTEEALAIVPLISHEPYRHMLHGRVALEQGEPERALAHFEAGLRLWPDNPMARYYAAIAAEQFGNFDRAIEHYRYAMRINAQATDAYLRLARLQEAAGRLDDALATLHFLPGGRPLENEAALLELRILASQGREREAPPRLLRQLSDPGLVGAAAAALSEGVRQRSGPAAAVETIRTTLDLDLGDPRHAEALGALVEHRAAAGDRSGALAEVDRALAAHPDSAIFRALRGAVLARDGGDVEAARRAYERALEIDPEERLALLGLARLESAGGAAEPALELFRRAHALDSGDRSAARGVGAELVALGRGQEAEAVYAAILREHPYDSEAALALARLRLERGVHDRRTLELARRALFFGGGGEAKRLLERVQGGTPEPGTAG